MTALGICYSSWAALSGLSGRRGACPQRELKCQGGDTQRGVTFSVEKEKGNGGGSFGDGDQEYSEQSSERDVK